MIDIMKAAYIEQLGPPENIRYGDIPLPAVRVSQVLVKVAAVTVNQVDTYIRAGTFPMELPLPFVIGRDMVGVVEAVGSAVTRFSPGDRVWCNNQGIHGRQGTFAEYVAVAEDLLYHLPAGVDWQEAVAILHSGLTTCLGLFREANLKPGETIFINGGSGNVGSALVQVAHDLGAQVIATVGSAEKRERVLELGADLAIDYKTENVSKVTRAFAPPGVDVYFDTSREPNFELAVPLLKHHGRMIVIAGREAHPTFSVGALYLKDCSVYGFIVTDATTEELHFCANKINHWLDQGKLKGKIDRVIPLAEAVTAHRLLEESMRNRDVKLNGKIVLIP